MASEIAPDDRLGAPYQYFRCIMNGLQGQVMVIDRDHRITDANTSFLHRMGRGQEAVGRRCYEVAYQRDEPCDGSICPLQQVWESGKPSQAFHVHCDRDGKKTYFRVAALPICDEQGQVIQVLTACLDVTAEQRMEAKLAALYALGRELVFFRDEVQVAHAVVNAARRVLEFQLCHLWLIDESGENLVCRAYAPREEPPAVFRMPLDGLRGITVTVACSGEAIYLADVSQDPRYVSGHAQTRSELCVPLKIGGRIIGVLNAESGNLDAFDEDDRRLFSALADEAALAIENARLFVLTREQREQLRTLTARLAEAEEAERQRLARELHDQVGQNLTALGINLNFVRMQMGEGVSDLVRSRLDDSLALIAQTVECIRNTMADLRPPVLDTHGVMAALRWYGSQVASRTGIAVAVRGKDPIPRLAPSVETALFRIAQEALTNIVKHAQTTQAVITMEVNHANVCLTIADNGLGFDARRLLGVRGQRGWGLLTMTERAAAVGGHCHIESHPGRGTSVIVEVPR